MDISLEQILVHHCAPVLLAKKPAAMIMIDKLQIRMLRDILCKIDRGVHIRSLRNHGNRMLILICRDELLQKALACPCAENILKHLGYPKNKALCNRLRFLKARLHANAGFPHEIGLFLGYPPEDVLGFIENQGQNYKYCKLWKVYGDVSQAKRLHAIYHACSERLQTFIQDGGNVYQLPIHTLAV